MTNWQDAINSGLVKAGVEALPEDKIGPTHSDPPLPSQRQKTVAILICAALALTAAICTPWASIELPAVPGFMTAFGTGMVVINALLAALLFSKGIIEKRPDVVRLGAAYFFVAILFIPLLLSFKDGFVPGTLIGTPASSVWLWSLWHSGFSIGIAWYAFNIGKTGSSPSIRTLTVAITAVIAGLVVLATAGINYLPTLLWNGYTFFPGILYVIPMGLLVLNVTAFFLCIRVTVRTTEHLWVTVAMVAACFDLWLTIIGGNRFALGWYLSKCGSLVTSFVVIASLYYDIIQLYRSSAEANHQLDKLAHRDGLTGVYNRRHFDRMLEQEWSRAVRQRQFISLLLVDVDFFKQFNDQYGHLAGDDCLRTVGTCLADAIHRPGDLVTRFGGEEFTVLLPGAGAEGALHIANTLKTSIEALQIPHASGLNGRLTISIGVSTRIPMLNERSQDLIQSADEALYLAKKSGRNQTVSATAQLSYGPLKSITAQMRTTMAKAAPSSPDHRSAHGAGRSPMRHSVGHVHAADTR